MKITRIIAALALVVLVTPAFARPVKATSVLVKGKGPATYFVANDGKRYVFPDAQTYFSWYPDFNGIQTVSDSELVSIPFGGVVTVRPGEKLVKIKTDPKVYAVSRYGTLRWLTTETVAKMIYGDNWAKKIIDLPEAQFANYTMGVDVTGPGQYWWMIERDSVASISTNVRARAVPSTVSLASTAPKGFVRIEATIVNGAHFNNTDSDIRLFVESTRVDNKKTVEFAPGDYTLYRTGLQGYVISDWGGDCSAQGYIAVRAGQTKVCTVTYTYSADAARLPLLRYVHTVRNDDQRNGWTASDFPVFIDGVRAANDVFYVVSPGLRRLKIGERNGYVTYDWGGDCNADGEVYLELGETKTCTIFSDDSFSL